MADRAWTWRHAIIKSDLPATTRHVLLTVSCYMNEVGGGCYPTQQQLSEATGLSDRAVRTHLEVAETAGWIKRTEHGFKGQKWRNHEYTASWPKGEEAGSAANIKGEERNSARVGKAEEAGSAKVRNEVPTNSPFTNPIAASQQQAGASKPETDFDNLQSKLIEAAGDKIQPHGVFDLSAIIGLIGAGVDLNTDILPTIKARCAKMRSPARGWAYFTDAIRDAYSRRVAAGEGLAKPVRAVTPDEELAPDVLEAEWQKRLSYARKSRSWFTAVWGPMPGKDGCRVPSKLLQPKDGQFPQGGDWLEQAPVRAA